MFYSEKLFIYKRPPSSAPIDANKKKKIIAAGTEATAISTNNIF
jgi:hypothetical protein